MRIRRFLVLILGLAASWTAHAQGDPCPGIDPRAHLAVGVCKIQDISQEECTRIGGQASFYNPGYRHCGFLVPQRTEPSRSGATRNRIGSNPSVPSAPNSRAGNAANTLGALSGLLGGLANLQEAYNAAFGRNPERDGDLVAGGMAPFSARSLDAIGLQYLMTGMSLEDQSLADSAADSYARAFDAADRAGDAELLKMVRERQFGLLCKNGIGMIMNTGQNPEDRFAKYQALRGTCRRPELTAVLEALIEIERDRLPPGAPGRALPQNSKPGDLARRLRKRLGEAETQSVAAEPGAPPVSPGGADPAPQPQATAAQQQPEESMFDRALAQQKARRRIFCEQTSDPGGCMSNDSFCIGAYSNNRSRSDECLRAFHDQNIWHDVMSPFYMDPAETRRGIDTLLQGAFTGQFK